MDIFTVMIFGGLILLVVSLLAIGFWHPRSGADAVDWKPTRSPELEAQLELDDIAQMLEAQNERRRRRGEDELSLEEIEQGIVDEQRSLKERSASYSDDVELGEMLAHANARRQRKGLPELTLDELRAEVEGPSHGS